MMNFKLVKLEINIHQLLRKEDMGEDKEEILPLLKRKNKTNYRKLPEMQPI
jgi:hypothetical protein